DALALEHCERFLALASKQGLRGPVIATFEEEARSLRAALTPVFVTASEPKSYTESSLREALKLRLAPEELGLVVDPLASTHEMKRGAQQLPTRGTNDLSRAGMLYDALTRRLNTGIGGTRTARETYAEWENPEVQLQCQEYARLYVALARDVGIRAY